MAARKRFLQSTVVSQESIAADAIVQRDLSVNPISVILVRVNCLNDNAGVAINGMATALEIAAAFNRLSVFHRGRTVISGRGEDLLALSYFRRGYLPLQANTNDTDNDMRSVVIPLYLGKFAGDDESCFPATRRGELVLEADIDVADTGYDNFKWQVETIELLDAKPKEFERTTSMSSTFAATGQNRFVIPPGNLLRYLMLWGTTAYTGGTPAPTWGTRIEFRLNNEQYGYSASDFDTLHSMSQVLNQRQLLANEFHTHRVDATGGATQQTGRPLFAGQNGWQNYAPMPFDLTWDDEYSIETAGSSLVEVRCQAGTADANRLLMVERIPVADFGVDRQ